MAVAVEVEESLAAKFPVLLPHLAGVSNDHEALIVFLLVKWHAEVSLSV